MANHQTIDIVSAFPMSYKELNELLAGLSELASRPPWDEKAQVWTTGDGRKFRPKEMTNEHLSNTVQWIEKKFKPEERPRWAYSALNYLGHELMIRRKTFTELYNQSTPGQRSTMLRKLILDRSKHHAVHTFLKNILDSPNTTDTELYAAAVALYKQKHTTHSINHNTSFGLYVTTTTVGGSPIRHPLGAADAQTTTFNLLKFGGFLPKGG